MKETHPSSLWGTRAQQESLPMMYLGNTVEDSVGKSLHTPDTGADTKQEDEDTKNKMYTCVSN